MTSATLLKAFFNIFFANTHTDMKPLLYPVVVVVVVVGGN